jgi:hypothetical protein
MELGGCQDRGSPHSLYLRPKVTGSYRLILGRRRSLPENSRQTCSMFRGSRLIDLENPHPHLDTLQSSAWGSMGISLLKSRTKPRSRRISVKPQWHRSRFVKGEMHPLRLYCQPTHSPPSLSKVQGQLLRVTTPLIRFLVGRLLLLVIPAPTQSIPYPLLPNY